MSATLTTEIFIQRARAIHGDKYDYSKVKYVNANSKVCIICPKHGEFWKRASRHLSGEICPQCSRGLIPSHWTREKCEAIARQYEYKKDFHLNNKLAYNAAEKHGWLKEFTWLKSTIKQTPKKAPHFYTQDEMVSLLREKLGDSYDYSKVVYRAMKIPVTLVCRICDENGQEHGEFSMRPDNIFSLGQGCPKCGIIKRNRTQSKDLADFISEARAIHNNKYTYDHVVYVNCKTKVNITCAIHGDFSQSPINHLKGKGCPYCSGNAKKWDEQTCKEAALRYEYMADFRRLVPGAWHAAQQKGWLKTYDWLQKLPPKNPDYTQIYRYIYAYEFTQHHAVYVGLTNSLKRRDWEHHNGKNHSAVFDFAEKKNCEVPPQRLLEQGVPVMESGEREHYWEDKYRQEGWKILNIAKTGKTASSLGALTELKWTKKAIEQAAADCDYDQAVFANRYPNAYSALMSRYREYQKVLFPNRIIHHSLEDAINVAKELDCHSRGELRKKCSWAHNLLYNHDLLDEFYPLPKPYTVEEAISESQAYRSIENIRVKNHRLWCFLRDNDLFRQAKPTDAMFRKVKTVEEAWDLSQYYPTISDLSNHAKTAYRLLRDNGLLAKRYPNSPKFAKKASKEPIPKSPKSSKAQKTKKESQYNQVQQPKEIREPNVSTDKEPRIPKIRASKWTREICAEHVSKYTTLRDFTNAEKHVYGVIRKRGWMDLLEHLERKQHEPYNYSIEDIKEICAPYHSLAELAKNRIDVANFCRKRDIDLIKLMGWKDLVKRVVLQMKDGQVIARHPSISAAAKSVGGDRKRMWDHIAKHQEYKGFMWVYAD